MFACVCVCEAEHLCVQGWCVCILFCEFKCGANRNEATFILLFSVNKLDSSVAGHFRVTKLTVGVTL